MSLSFLSHQDVESGLPEPASGKSAGVITKLFVAISTALSSLTTVLSNVDDGQRCRNEIERFFLWAKRLLIVEGDLDEVLAHSEELRFRVLSLLSRLGTVILHNQSRDPLSQSKVLTEQYDNLRTLLHTTEAKLQESAPETVRSDTIPALEASEDGVKYILDGIAADIDCLLDLAPSLDNLALDVQAKGVGDASMQDKESFATSSEEALIYCRRIRDRFRSLPKYLVERLAEANALRAAALRFAQSRPPKHDPNDDIAPSIITESLFATANPGVSEPTKSTAPSNSTFSSIMRAPTAVTQFSDKASAATVASFSTARSTIHQGRLPIPPIPELEGNGFNCSICGKRVVVDILTRKAWKKHVFDDLKPYVCTIEGCKEPMTLYDRGVMWAQHEASHPVSTVGSPKCPFCAAVYQQAGPTYFKHVSAHLQEVSLSVLPRSADEDDAFDDDGGEPVSSASHHTQQGRSNADISSSAESTEYPSAYVIEEEPQPSQGPSHSTIVDSELGLHLAANTQRGTLSGQQGTPSQTESVQVVSKLADHGGVMSQSDGQSASASTLQTALDNATEIDLDLIIGRLLEVRGSGPGRLVSLPEAEIRYLCTQAREIFISQPTLLELESPIKICGDIHGQYYDLLRIFEYQGFPPRANYLFLGNYVDYGKQSLETICLLLAYKIKYPENFFVLRGNHEVARMNRIFGFYDECKQRYSIKLWKTFVDCFNCLPVAAIIDEKILALHGGLSPDLNSMEQIRRIQRPTDMDDSGLLCDLLCSGPDPGIKGWSEKGRGLSFTFGPDVVSRFLRQHDMDLIVRSNQVVEDGYEFFAGRRLITLFGAPSWRGEGDNAGAIMSVDESLLCSFQVLKPVNWSLAGNPQLLDPAERTPKFGRR